MTGNSSTLIILAKMSQILGENLQILEAAEYLVHKTDLIVIFLY